MRSSPRLLFASKIALALAALAGLGWLVEWGALVAAARAARAGWVLAALALLPLNVVLEAYRWHRLVRHAAPGVGFARSLGAVVGSYPLGLLTPGRLGDLAGRALFVRDLPGGVSAAFTVAERMATLWCCLAAGVLALPFWIRWAAPAAPVAWAGVGVAAGVAVLLLGALLLRPQTARRLLGTVLPFPRLRPALDALGQVPAREARALLALSALRYVVFSAQFVLLVRAFAPAAPWASAAVGVALVFFAKSAIPSATLGDLGVREGAAVFFLVGLGVAAPAAFNASLALFAVNLLLPALAGLPLLLRLRLERAAVPDRAAAASTAAAAS